MEMDLDEALERAKKLNDDARRALVDQLRQSVERGEIEFDEREEHLRLADSIEALIASPDAAPAEPTDIRLSRAKAQVRTVLKRARRDGCAEIGPLVDKLKAMPDQQGVLQMLIDVRDEESWILRDLIVSIIGKVAGRTRGVNPNNIQGVSRPIGDRGRDDGATGPDRESVDGARPHITRHRTEFDRKEIGLNKSSPLDHVKPGKRRRRAEPIKVPLPLRNTPLDHTEASKKARTAAFKSMGGEGEPAEVRTKRYRGPRPPKREPDPQHKYGNRSKTDWRAMVRGDGPLPEEKPDAGPAVSEAAMYRATKDHAKVPVTMEQIKRQAEEARAAAEEKAANTSDVKHHDDPEFKVGAHRDDFERQAKGG